MGSIVNTSTPRVDGTPTSTEVSDAQSFWETADRKILQQLLTGNMPAATYSDEDVFGYMSNTVDFSALPRRVAIGVSSRGNFFMAEIARVLEDAFRQLGTQVRMFSESDALTLSFTDPVLIVAPHEFFLLGNGKKLLKALSGASALIMVNTEQPQTRWFGVAETYLKKASAVLDVNFESARHLAAAGYKAFVLPLAYSDYIARTFDGSTLPDHELFGPLGVGAHAAPPAQYSDRPIDILFVGTASPRRDRFFAGAAHFLASKNCFLYMPDGDTPFAAGESRTIDTAAFVALAKRSKILLNIHR